MGFFEFATQGGGRSNRAKLSKTPGLDIILILGLKLGVDVIWSPETQRPGTLGEVPLPRLHKTHQSPIFTLVSALEQKENGALMC